MAKGAFSLRRQGNPVAIPRRVVDWRTVSAAVGFADCPQDVAVAARPRAAIGCDPPPVYTEGRPPDAVVTSARALSSPTTHP